MFFPQLPLTQSSIDDLNNELQPLMEFEDRLDDLKEEDIPDLLSFIHDNLLEHYDYILRAIANEFHIRIQNWRTLCLLWCQLQMRYKKEVSFYALNLIFETFTQYLSYLKAIDDPRPRKPPLDIPVPLECELTQLNEDDFSLKQITHALVDDNIDFLTENASRIDFDSTIDAVVQHNQFDNIVTLCAKYGATKCFKYFFLNQIQPTSLTAMAAVCSGNLEIIRICQSCNVPMNRCIIVAVMWHRMDIFNWLLTTDFENDPISLAECIYYFNTRALMKFLEPTSDLNEIARNGIGKAKSAFPLYSIAKTGHYKLLKFFIKHGADPSMTTKTKSNILCVAAQEGFSKIVEYLVKHGMSLERSTHNEFSPLYIAAYYGNLDVVKLLIENGADMNRKTTKKGYTAFHGAATHGNLDICKYFVEKGIEITQLIGYYSLVSASKNGFINIVEYLLSVGIKPYLDGPPDDNHPIKDNENPLVQACLFGFYEIAKLLIEKGAPINTLYTTIQPLYAACSSESIECVKLLVENGADVMALNLDTQLSALDKAANKNNLEIVQYLVDHNAKLNNWKTLFSAIDSPGPEVFEYFIKNREKVGWNDEYNESCFLQSVKDKKYDICKMILTLIPNIDINARGERNASALYMAAQNNDIETLLFLLEKGADTEALNDKGASPLCVACQEGHLNIVRTLLEWGANINITFAIGVTPLFLSCQNQFYDIAKYLCEHGAIVDQRENNAQTPLYVSVANRNFELVQLLVEHGANVNIKSVKGPILSVSHSQQITNYLISNGAVADI